MSFLTKCLIILGIVIAGALILANMGGNKTKTNGSQDNDKALNRVKAELKVKDAVITAGNVLYVSVEDDGTSRDGYASYICELTRDFNSSVNRIKVVKYNSKNETGATEYGVLLGETLCK